MSNYLLSSDDYAPVTGQVLVVADGGKQTIKSATVNISGLISGPGSSTDNALVRWNGTTGAAVQNSNATLSDAGALTVALGLTVTAGGAAITGTTTINNSGTAVTTIGTGGLGAVNIGNTMGNTAVTGSLAATATLTAGTGITATNGNFVFGTAGNKVTRPAATTTTAGANSFGSVTLVGGTATVSTTAVTASSLIKLWRQSIGSTGAQPLGFLTIGTITANTSFVINAVEVSLATSLQTTDVSVVGWEIVN